MLSELHRKPPPRGSVESAQEALDNPFGDDLETSQPRYFKRIEQVQPGAGGFVATMHGRGNVSELSLGSQTPVALELLDLKLGSGGLRSMIADVPVR
jgi:hypothetical protein